MNFTKIDFSLFRKTESSSAAAAGSSAAVSPRSRVRATSKSSSSSLLRDGYDEDARTRQVADEFYGLKQLSKSLADVSKSLRYLHKGFESELNGEPVVPLKEDFTRAFGATKRSMDILSKAPRVEPSVRIQMKNSLREIDLELARAQDEMKVHSRRPFKQSGPLGKELSSWASSIEEARKLAIQLRQDVDLRITKNVATLGSKSQGVTQAARKSGPLQQLPFGKTEDLSGLATAVVRSFSKSPEKSILAQSNPKRDSIVNLLYKERNLTGELTMESPNDWKDPSSGLLKRTDSTASRAQVETQESDSTLESK